MLGRAREAAIYGLTKGQSSPTSPKNLVTKTAPYDMMGESLNPAFLALAYGATFVARGAAVKREHLSRLIEQGIQHRGFSFIEILTSCSSFNTKHLAITKVLQRMAFLEGTPDNTWKPCAWLPTPAKSASASSGRSSALP